MIRFLFAPMEILFQKGQEKNGHQIDLSSLLDVAAD